MRMLKSLIGQEENCLKNKLLFWEGDIGTFEKMAIERNPSALYAARRAN
jgi:hypothetical protein